MIDKILKNLLEHKILILDGAMGTMIQKHSLTENDFRGNEFRNINKLVKGNNDLLNIFVNGYNLDPCPPANITPFITFFLL